MKLLALFIPLLVLLAAGCTSAPITRVHEAHPNEQAQIRKRLDEILDAAVKQDFERLDSYHLYGPKFTKFTSSATGRLDADAAREGEHQGLGSATDLRMRAEELKIDVFNDVGIATFLLDYSVKNGATTINKKVRSTLVFVHDEGQWKITHEHLSGITPN